MANAQYLLWVMIGTLTLLSIFIGVVVGRTKTPRVGFATFAGLWVFSCWRYSFSRIKEHRLPHGLCGKSVG